MSHDTYYIFFWKYTSVPLFTRMEVLLTNHETVLRTSKEIQCIKMISMQVWAPDLDPRTHINTEGGNWLYRIVFWLSHTWHGTCVTTFSLPKHITYTLIINKIKSLKRSPPSPRDKLQKWNYLYKYWRKKKLKGRK